MPVSRFALYFFALAACSTVAFASGLDGQAAATDGAAALEAASARPPTSAEVLSLRHNLSPRKIAQVARAN